MKSSLHGSSSADVNRSGLVRINCNFVTDVKLTVDERCLIHKLRVEVRNAGVLKEL